MSNSIKLVKSREVSAKNLCFQIKLVNLGQDKLDVQEVLEAPR